MRGPNLGADIPSKADASDLSDDQIGRAEHTRDQAHLIELLRGVATLDPETSIARYEIRRRSPHLYLRTIVQSHGGSQKILIYRIDWMQQG